MRCYERATRERSRPSRADAVWQREFDRIEEVGTPPCRGFRGFVLWEGQGSGFCLAWRERCHKRATRERSRPSRADAVWQREFDRIEEVTVSHVLEPSCMAPS